MSACDICHTKRTFWNRVKLNVVFISMSFDYGRNAILCEICAEKFRDPNQYHGNPYWRVAEYLGWQ